MFGIFNGDGLLLEGDFDTGRGAMQFMRTHYSPDDELYVAVICEQHPEQEADNCKSCNSEVVNDA